MSLFKNKYIAHRGFHHNKLIPENSLLAFKKAIENNYSVEFDINITNDNKIVVFHDENLYRLCNKKENIEEVKYSFLKDLNLYETDEKIPLLEEVLSLVNGKITLIIEIKKHKNIGLLEEIVFQLLGKYKGEYFLCSFEKDILIYLKTSRLNHKIGLIFETLPNNFRKYEKILFLYRFFKVKPDFVSLDEKLLDSSIYIFCKKKGIEIITWTIKNKNRYEEIAKKVDGIIFENFLI